ncbi:zinc-binding dehydrogenase [Anaeromicropila populeti]|uniref:Ribulose-5-phosphate reductase n=1 Tax=Anaeromicropila populeti TaxID=37658 RepID=A0A1I6HWE5_9FIRM|nr:zinc-binding dehydrogenase [Anaeromicropila populeti]SFR58747.1 ribitol-5-phosphate 2-dehydrogenase [Anaeromicropila populeti]
MINAVYRLVAPRRIEIAFEDIDLTKPEVLVRPTKLSICNADQRYYQGSREPKILEQKLPMALIHEAMGEVIYDPTKTFSIGERVVLIPNIPGRQDDVIKENYRRDSGFCSSGIDGFLQEYVQIPVARLVRLPEKIPNTVGAFVELLSVSFHAIQRFMCFSHSRKERIGVWGDGNLGYITALLLKKTFPQSIITVIGVHDYKLSDFTFVDETYLITELPMDMELDHVFECVGNIGSQKALEQIVDLIKPEGTISLMGVSEFPIQINTRMVLEKGLRIYGSSRSGREDFEGLIEFITEHNDVIEHLEKIVAAVIPIHSIADIQSAFESDIAKSLGKTVMDWKE